MVSENQLKILKLMNLSESKANIDTAYTEFKLVQCALDNIMNSLVKDKEFDSELKVEYNEIDKEIYHINRFIDKLSSEIRDKKQVIENDMFKILEE